MQIVYDICVSVYCIAKCILMITTYGIGRRVLHTLLLINLRLEKKNPKTTVYKLQCYLLLNRKKKRHKFIGKSNRSGSI